MADKCFNKDCEVFGGECNGKNKWKIKWICKRRSIANCCNFAHLGEPHLKCKF